MIHMGKIITIGREFGSGGREVGKRLSDELGIAYYDNEIITEIAKRTELAEGYVQHVMENGPTALMPITIGRTFYMGADPVMEQNNAIYREQSLLVQELAENSDCVIVGRSADYICATKSRCACLFMQIWNHAWSDAESVHRSRTFYRQRAETSYSGCG